MSALPSISDPRSVLKSIRNKASGQAELALASPRNALAGGGESNTPVGSDTYDNSSHSSHSSQPAIDRHNSSRKSTIEKNRLHPNNINDLGECDDHENMAWDQVHRNQNTTPARVAKVARVQLSGCITTENCFDVSARVRLEQFADPAREVDLGDAEERAAIMEFDGGLDRTEAERFAGLSATVPAESGNPAPLVDQTRAQRRLRRVRGVADLPIEWVDGALSLSADRLPCPGFRDGQWVRTYQHLVDFLTGPLAVEAAQLGWTTELMFGVHPIVGMANVSAWGACMLADRKPILAVERDAIRFERGTFYRPLSRNASVPVWGFGK